MIIAILVTIQLAIWASALDEKDNDEDDHYTYTKYYGIPLERDNKKSSSYYYEKEKP